MSTGAKLPAGDVARALEAMPLFPLPQVVLMPGSLLPLHVFEPRYRKMVRDVIDGHGIIGVVQLAPATHTPEGCQPAIRKVAGAGVLVDCAELPGGRFNILLRGVARVELVDELELTQPYRRARARVIDDEPGDVSSAATAGLISAATAFASLLQRRDPSFEFSMPKLSDAAALANHFAMHLLIDGRDRQRALELRRVGERVSFVTQTLAVQQVGLAGPAREMN